MQVEEDMSPRRPGNERDENRARRSVGDVFPSIRSGIRSTRAVHTNSQSLLSGRVRDPRGEAARWPSWASAQKTKISFNEGGGWVLGEYEEAIEFVRQVHDALKSGTEGQAYSSVKIIETSASYDLRVSAVGLDPMCVARI